MQHFVYAAAVFFLEFGTAVGTCLPCQLCQTENRLDRTAQFVMDRASCMPHDKVVDLRAFTTVYDLTCCPVKTHRAYNHKLMDCMVPSMQTLRAALNAHAGEGVAIIPANLADFYDVIFPGEAPVERRLHDPRSIVCYIVSREGAVVDKAKGVDISDIWKANHVSGAWTAFDAATRHGLKSAGQTAGQLGPSADDGAITLIQRSHSRAFVNLQDILAALQAAFDLTYTAPLHFIPRRPKLMPALEKRLTPPWTLALTIIMS